MLDSHNKGLIIDDLIEMHDLLEDIEKLESKDLVQPEDRLAVGNLTDLITIERFTNFRKYRLQRRAYFSKKQGIKKLLVCYEEIL
ncbi:hypothetical protein TNCV_2336661 [Trichonephila clavipes]|nr:hypothetical protein TNCV_2336661 [Trichonephila clavipes]